MPERMASLEANFNAFQERYDRDTTVSASSRAGTKRELEQINMKLALLNDKEQQAIGMLRAAKIGWFVLGALGSGAAWAGWPKLAAWLMAK